MLSAVKKGKPNGAWKKWPSGGRKQTHTKRKKHNQNFFSATCHLIGFGPKLVLHELERLAHALNANNYFFVFLKKKKKKTEVVR